MAAARSTASLAEQTAKKVAVRRTFFKGYRENYLSHMSAPKPRFTADEFVECHTYTGNFRMTGSVAERLRHVDAQLKVVTRMEMLIERPRINDKGSFLFSPHAYSF